MFGAVKKREENLHPYLRSHQKRSIAKRTIRTLMSRASNILSPPIPPIPVLAGFGIRSAAQLSTVAEQTDGGIVGSALIEVLERGDDPVDFLRSLRPSLPG